MNAERKREYQRAYQAANKEKLRELRAARYTAHKEKVLERCRQYRTANKEKVRERRAAHYAANKEKRREQKAAYYAANRERERERSAAYRATHAEKVRERERKYRAANPEKVRERVRECARKYRAANPEKVREQGRQKRIDNPGAYRAYSASRRAMKIAQRCICCADAAIKKIYDIAALCGAGAHVDHKIQLSLGGPHCAKNLEALTAESHIEKTRLDSAARADVRRRNRLLLNWGRAYREVHQ